MEKISEKTRENARKKEAKSIYKVKEHRNKISLNFETRTPTSIHPFIHPSITIMASIEEKVLKRYQGSLSFNNSSSYILLLCRINSDRDYEEVRLKQSLNIDGVDYPIKVIETTMIKGKRKALIKVLPYYTENIYVNPGDEEILMAKTKRKESPDEADL